MTAGRLLAILIAFVVFMGGAYAAWRLNTDRVGYRRREAQLKQQLSQMRQGIAKYKEKHGRYPRRLDDLVPQHIPAIPVDPFTNSSTNWRLTTEQTVEPNTDFTSSTAQGEIYIVDVHSGAGTPYSTW